MARGIARQPLLAGFQELLRPSVIEALGDPLPATQFGDAVLLDETRSMSASARSDCVLLGLTRDEIIESFTKDPNAALKIIEAVFRKLASTMDELIRLKAGMTS